MTSADGQGRVALVTAASQGIGAGVARVLASRGYRVALLARSEAVLALAEEVGGIGVRGSVESEADLQRLVTAALESYGRIDAVVNNTGHPAKGDLLTLTDQEWRNGYDLILGSVIRMARLTTPVLRAQGGGSIVNLSSYAAYSPEAERPVSSVFRAGLAAWTRVYAEYAAGWKIRVNSVLPGFIETRPQPAPATGEIPLGRYGHVEEIGKTVAFLLSGDASYITGQSLLVDGGMVRRL
ncbi:MAG: SDR family oxidoreductase [Terracidiphilus sp.]